MSKGLTMKNIIPIAFVLLSAIATISALSTQTVSAQEAHEITTVTILPTTGGITNLSEGNHSYANATVLTVTATPESGHEFLYWNVTGIMNIEGEHGDMANETGDMEHGGPFGTLSDLDSLILTDKSVTITIDCAYTYQYQPVFTASQNVSPNTSTNNETQKQNIDSNNTTLILAVGVIGAIAAISAAAGLYIKRKKSVPST